MQSSRKSDSSVAVAGAPTAFGMTHFCSIIKIAVCSDFQTLKPKILESVVGVDVEAEDGGDFYGLASAHGGLEFPGAQGGYKFGRGFGRAGFEHVDVSHVARGVEGAFYHHAHVRQAGGNIDAHGQRRRKCGAEGMGGCGFIGKFHADRAGCAVEISAVGFAVQKILVGLKGSAGAGGGNNRYAELISVLGWIGASRG
jgi:hypothetical protein